MGGPAHASLLLPGSTSGLAEGNRREFSVKTFSLIRKGIRMENFDLWERVASSGH